MSCPVCRKHAKRSPVDTVPFSSGSDQWDALLRVAQRWAELDSGPEDGEEGDESEEDDDVSMSGEKEVDADAKEEADVQREDEAAVLTAGRWVEITP